MFGLPAWFDVTTAEPAKTIEFYMQLFDWSAEPIGPTDFGQYILFRKEGLPVAGVLERSADTTQQNGWLTYLSTADAPATIAAAQGNQGSVLRPVLPIPEIGEIAVITDPVDSAIGIVQAGDDAKTAPAGLGTPVWTEIETVDWPVTLQFLTTTFDLHTETQSATPGSRFATIHDEDHPRGGVFELPAEVTHSRWEVAFLVADAQQTLDRAVALGATVVRPVYNVPVGTGFGARLADPAGAHFNVIAF
ncbi:VOC family protein [Nocardia sp. NPDC006630]|uniref:VOC family protein n=1 Tax=Nocardia sp. NPDC006630 TaxID=3157181 RepID=UPI0033BAE704